MEITKNISKDQKGFIFTLDATLAVLISILALASVVTIGSPTTFYEQQGYRRLEEYTNETLQVMEVEGVIDNIETLLWDNTDDAKALTREKLHEILPEELQFRMKIGSEPNQLIIFPTQNNDAAWENQFENAIDIATGVRISIIDNKFVPITLYLWRGEGP